MTLRDGIFECRKILMRIPFILHILLLGICAVAQVAAPQGIQTFKFGDCKVVCIQDALMRLPARLFSDTASTGHRLSGGFHESSVNVFLVQKDGNVFLVDAGHDQMRGSLRGKLKQAGISPEAVSGVLITHLHPDHVGGLLWDGKPLFPSAILYIAKEEYETWRKDASRNSLAKYLTPYEGRIRLFEYGTALPNGVVPEKRGGHTPGHTIFRMSHDGRDELVFVGDIAHAVDLQFPHPTFCAKYDASPAEAVASRIQTLKMKGILFGAHFPFPGIARGGQVAKGAPNWAFVWKKYDSAQ